MIRNLFIALFLSIFLLDSLKKHGLIPAAATLAPEVLSILTTLLVVFATARRRYIDASPIYVVLGLLIIVHIVCGIFVNQVDTGVIFSGMRVYLKYVPFFLVPMIFKFSEADLQTHFKLIVGFTLLQLPVALVQRLVLSAGTKSGDLVGGTLVLSSFLSIYLICFTAILLGAHLKGMIKRRAFFVLVVLTLIPTTINETKGTFILLPIALLLPVLFNSLDPHRFRRVLLVSMFGALFFAAYIPIYDYFREKSIVDYWTNTSRLEYLFAPQTLGQDEERVGRIDVMLAPTKEFSDDPLKLFFGLGIGNTGESKLGEQFSGEYAEQYAGLTFLGIAKLQWEIGVYGTALVLALLFCLARDAHRVALRNDIYGALALGWMGVLGVLFVSLFYKNVISSSTISYLFWFYSGVIVSSRYLTQPSVGAVSTGRPAGQVRQAGGELR